MGHAYKYDGFGKPTRVYMFVCQNSKHIRQKSNLRNTKVIVAERKG